MGWLAWRCYSSGVLRTWCYFTLQCKGTTTAFDGFPIHAHVSWWLTVGRWHATATESHWSPWMQPSLNASPGSWLDSTRARDQRRSLTRAPVPIKFHFFETGWIFLMKTLSLSFDPANTSRAGSNYRLLRVQRMRQAIHRTLSEGCIFVVFFFFSVREGKEKNQGFWAMRLWRGPSTTHDLSFPKLLHCFISMRQGRRRSTSLAWIPLTGLLLKCFSFSSSVVNFGGTIDRIANRAILWQDFNFLFFAPWCLQNTSTFLLFFFYYNFNSGTVKITVHLWGGKQSWWLILLFCGETMNTASAELKVTRGKGKKKSIPGQRSARFVLPASHKLKLN